ncbi:hypothetical protein BD324DRAFT_654251 [Kockovaella imperatae]|uniref:Major facilitator superfamily domain-containing protein n=1 Tax=Kockovaella imperatae TaxID=4999 RepID=A0A1Y1U5N5_9TREE|nr:hypothetical protein BD324DRAFT_654251 [Kockovaella imperatae]ORX33302.1 hypothetical protein BD324DRAFT_654251 [Kockovaella imperatae]
MKSAFEERFENDGKGAAAAPGSSYVPDSPEEGAMLRKIDLHLLPMLWIMYVFNYVDRTNIGNAKTGGMQDQLHLSSSDYSLVLSIFFRVRAVVWDAAQLPGLPPQGSTLQHDLGTEPTFHLSSPNMFIWGCMSIGVRGVNSLAGIVIVKNRPIRLEGPT